MTRKERAFIKVLATLAGKPGRLKITVDGCSFQPTKRHKPCSRQQQEKYLISSRQRNDDGDRRIKPAYLVIRPCKKHLSIWIPERERHYTYLGDPVWEEL